MSKFKRFFTAHGKGLIVLLAAVALLGVFAAVDLFRARVYKVAALEIAPYQYDAAKNSQKISISVAVTRDGSPVAGHKVQALSLGGGNFASDTVITDEAGNATLVYYPYTETSNKPGVDIAIRLMDTSNSVFLEINATSTVVVKKELLWPITPLKESLRAHCAGFDRSLYSEETQALLDSVLAEGLRALETASTVSDAEAVLEQYRARLGAIPIRTEEVVLGQAYEQAFPVGIEPEQAQTDQLEALYEGYSALTAVGKAELSEATLTALTEILQELYIRSAALFEARLESVIAAVEEGTAAPGQYRELARAYEELKPEVAAKLSERTESAVQMAALAVFKLDTAASLESEYLAYDAELYSTQNWTALGERYAQGLARIEAAETRTEAENAALEASAGMKEVETLLIEHAKETAVAFEAKWAELFALEDYQLSAADWADLEAAAAEYDGFNNNLKIIRELSDNAYQKIIVIKGILSGDTVAVVGENPYWWAILLALILLLAGGGAFLLLSGRRQKRCEA